MAFFMLSGFGAYGGSVLAMLSAAAAMTATCSSESIDCAANALYADGEIPALRSIYTLSLS